MAAFQFTRFKQHYIAEAQRWHDPEWERSYFTDRIISSFLLWADCNIRSWNPLRMIPSIFIISGFFAIYTWGWILVSIMESILNR